MSHFQNRLHAVTVGARATETKPAPATSAGAANPFSRRCRARNFAPWPNDLNANVVFVGKLRDRQIDARTMTPSFQRRVAEELEAPLEVVVAHFAASQSAPLRQFFKAEGETIGRRSADLRRGGRRNLPALPGSNQQSLLEL